MKLFNLEFDSNANLLSKEGTVNYFGKVLVKMRQTTIIKP